MCCDRPSSDSPVNTSVRSAEQISQPSSSSASTSVAPELSATKSKPHVSRPDAKGDPNYSACVPIASDVDCAGGRGNGPAYVRGPVRVLGNDIYDLDRDHDGIACE